MFLAVDIGNTDIVMGLYDAGVWNHLWRHASASYLRFDQSLVGGMRDAGLDLKNVQTCMLSSVVPQATAYIHEKLSKHLGFTPLLLGPDLYGKLEIDIDNPREIGTDLVANAVAAYTQVRQACIVVDFGTALTFTVVSESGAILGVSIAPGLKTAIRALFMNAAQLPEVPLALPSSVIGKNTKHALQSGILWGYVGLIKELVARIKAELQTPVKVVATGGLSGILVAQTDSFDLVDPTLTLEGMRIIAQNLV